MADKERLAALVERRRFEFDMALSDKRRYPMDAFKSFWKAGMRYSELTRKDPMLHRNVVKAVNGLREYLEVERKRVPGSVLMDAERLESMLFSGYDPYFEGDEPPGL